MVIVAVVPMVIMVSVAMLCAVLIACINFFSIVLASSQIAHSIFEETDVTVFFHANIARM